MLVGKILQQRYHIVAQVNNDELCKTYIALEKSAAPQIAKYIIRHFPPTDQNAEEGLAMRLRMATQLQQLNGLSHQIPKLFQCWLQKNHLFLAYEYIDSHCLSTELVPGQRYPDSVVSRIVAEIMAALQPLHQQQIGHGNLHLRQFMRRESDQKMIVTDVGLAALSTLQPIHHPQAIQQDLQAIGIIAIQALTGKAVSQLTDQTGKIHWQQETDCGEELATLINRLIITDPVQCCPSIIPAAIEADKMINPQDHIQPSTDAVNSMAEIELEEIKIQADQKFLQGDAQGAIAGYDEMIKRDPQPMYYHNRGIIYSYALGNYEQACQDHTTALTRKPDFASAYQNRAHAQRMLGNLSAAIQDYSESLRLLPNTALIYWERGLTYQQMGDLPAALADYTRFLEYQPYHAEAYHQRGNVHQMLGNAPAAALDYDRSIEINPLSALTYYDRGGLQAQQSNIAAAIADYTQAIEIDPQLVRAYNNRGILKRRQGDLVGAIADYSQGLSVDPDSLDCLRNRGIARQQLPDVAGAIADFQRAANMYRRQGQQSEYEKILKVLEILQSHHAP